LTPVRRNEAVTQLVQGCLSDDEYAALQAAIIANPEAGVVVRGSGGVRKLRWGPAGRGKPGGIRVICCRRPQRGQIWMLTLYAKSEADSIGAGPGKIEAELDGKD
jgi:hypothetical protein